MNRTQTCCRSTVVATDWAAGHAALEDDPPRDRAAWALARLLIEQACPACGYWHGSPLPTLDRIAPEDEPTPAAWVHLQRHGWVIGRRFGLDDTPHAGLPLELDLVLPPCPDPACHCARCRLVPATVTDLDQYARARRDRTTAEHREAL